MMVGMLYIVVTTKGIETPDFREVIDGMIITLFIAFIFIGISLKRIIIILTMPLVLSILIILLFSNLSPAHLFSISSNLVFATVILIIVSIQKRQLLLNEFSSRKDNESKIHMNEKLILQLKKQIETNKSLMEELNKLAMIDELTEVNSRYAGIDKLKSLLHNNKRKGFISLVFIDIDNLKLVNDTYGHDEGDKYLVYVINIIRKNLRNYDYIFRYGGDEFIILLENTSLDITEIKIKKFREELLKSNKKYPCNFSYGISVSTNVSTQSYEELIYEADKAMYIMKKNSKS